MKVEIGDPEKFVYKQPSPAVVRSIIEHGFAVIPEALSEEDCAKLKEALSYYCPIKPGVQDAGTGVHVAYSSDYEVNLLSASSEAHMQAHFQAVLDELLGHDGHSALFPTLSSPTVNSLKLIDAVPGWFGREHIDDSNWLGVRIEENLGPDSISVAFTDGYREAQARLTLKPRDRLFLAGVRGHDRSSMAYHHFTPTLMSRRGRRSIIGSVSA